MCVYVAVYDTYRFAFERVFGYYDNNIYSTK